ncbi:MAG TPA: ABC transporter substrate-binding protein [Methylomirabilota bacterium]|nr:ABC transporter substrate-binding protein [Methylomirabilota bacterium]
MRKNRTLVLGAALLALVVSACGPGEDGSPAATGDDPAADLPTITIGSAPFWESAVVAEIYAQAMEAEGFTVERQLELGPRDTTHAAITSGEINMVPEYLGGYLAQTFGGEPTPDVDETHDALVAALADEELVAFEPTPGTDADGFAVRQETADELGLATMSDLAEVADQLAWGVALQCADNPNCGPGLERVYGIVLADLDVETLEACTTAIADALNADAIDVAQVCTTQPEIERFNFVLLDDDGGLQPAQNLVPVVTQEVADAGGELLASTLNAVSEMLTTEELTSLGVTVVLDGESYADAARQWLEDHSL